MSDLIDPENNISSIGAVIVTYNTDPRTLRTLLARLTPQVACIFIVDNGSNNSPEICEAAQSVDHAKAILCPTNLGIGNAHNLGIEACRDAGVDMVLLLDQDSLPKKNMVYKLEHAFRTLSLNESKLAAVGARYTGRYDGHESFFVQFRTFRFQKVFCDNQECGQTIQADMLISSGCLMPLSAIDAIGNMDPDLFIDHVDTDWFLRAKFRGWRSYGVCDALMEHSIGDDTLRIWWGRWRYLPLHKPFRYYYIYRNSILLYRQKHADRLWRRADILRLTMMFFIFALFGEQKVSNLKMAIRGIKDGMSGKTGRLAN